MPTLHHQQTDWPLLSQRCLHPTANSRTVCEPPQACSTAKRSPFWRSRTTAWQVGGQSKHGRVLQSEARRQPAAHTGRRCQLLIHSMQHGRATMQTIAAWQESSCVPEQAARARHGVRVWQATRLQVRSPLSASNTGHGASSCSSLAANAAAAPTCFLASTSLRTDWHLHPGRRCRGYGKTGGRMTMRRRRTQCGRRPVAGAARRRGHPTAMAGSTASPRRS